MEKRIYNHFKNIEHLYGKTSYIQMPNSIFKDLSGEIKGDGANIKQISFAYSYLVVIAFLYKYAHFVDVDNRTYIQNSDIKQILGYGKTTKTIDKIIKKGGVLEQLNLIETTKKYPVHAEYTQGETINGLAIREFVTIDEMHDDSINYNTIKSIVKNKNYEIKKPIFLFEYNGDIGTLYNYENTHKITIVEFLEILSQNNLDNIDFMMYLFLKSKCYGLKDNKKSITLRKITSETGIGKDAFYTRLKNLKNNNYVEVAHKGWQEAEANEYCFMGVKN